MLSLISSINKPHVHRVCASKEEFFEVLNKIYDICIAKGCDHFDLIIDTDTNYEED